MESQAELDAAVSVIVRAWVEAAHLGRVSDHIYREISGKEMHIETVRSFLMSRLKGYLADIAMVTRAEDRRKWIKDKADACVTDLQSLARVHTAWLAWTAMRIDHVQDEPRHAEMLREGMTKGDEQARKLILELADQLQRELGLIENASDRRVGRLKSAKLTRARALSLREQVTELVPMITHVDRVSRTLLVGNSAMAERVARVTALLESRAVVAEFVKVVGANVSLVFRRRLVGVAG